MVATKPGPACWIVNVERERHGSALRDFLASARAERPVTHGYAVTREIDVILILRLDDMAEFNALCDRIFRNDLGVRRFRTSFVMRVAKESTTIEPNPALSRAPGSSKRRRHGT